MLYKVTNKITGETYIGSMKRLSKIMNVCPTSISRAAIDGKTLSSWNIDRITGVDLDSDEVIPDSYWDKWEKITSPFKKISKRKVEHKDE